MSEPQIPQIDLDREQVVNLLLASIAMEELGLAHLINAEAEKVQFALETLANAPLQASLTLNQLTELNESVIRFLNSVTNKEVVLSIKLSETLRVPGTEPPIPAACACSTALDLVDVQVTNITVVGLDVASATLNGNIAFCTDCTPDGSALSLSLDSEVLGIPVNIMTLATTPIDVNQALCQNGQLVLQLPVNVTGFLSGAFTLTLTLDETADLLSLQLSIGSNTFLSLSVGALGINIEACS
jgi:hypothetical protein